MTCLNSIRPRTEFSSTASSKRQRRDTNTTVDSFNLSELDGHTSKKPRLESSTEALNTSSLGTLARLAPEIRNAIYELVFEIPQKTFLVAAAGGIPRLFQLRERSDEVEYDAVKMVQRLGGMGGQIREEVRTFFYASNFFQVCAYGFEYLPVFIRWLEAVGSDCRAVLHKISLVGFMWYELSEALTAQFYDLLSDCTGLRQLTIQLNIQHLYEKCISNLYKYLEHGSTEDSPEDSRNDSSGETSARLQIDIDAWAELIAKMPGLKDFRLDFVWATDVSRVGADGEPYYRAFDKKSIKKLATSIKKQLKKRVREMDQGTEVAVEI